MNILFASNLSQIPFIKHGFFDRTGGYSTGIFESLNVGIKRGDNDASVLKNRTKIAKYFGQKTLFIPKQVHSNIPHFIDNINTTDIECDAFITNKPNILIGINTADCAPILLCDTEKRYIAAIHSGWRGAIAGIIENTVSTMKKLGCENLVCAVGPCIQQDSFEVGNEIISNVDRKYIKNNHFDLPHYVSDKLINLGISDLCKIDIDTFSNNEYFSYRRNTIVNKIRSCGVQFSGIVITENNDE